MEKYLVYIGIITSLFTGFEKMLVVYEKLRGHIDLLISRRKLRNQPPALCEEEKCQRNCQ